ncbi:hypothetical protein [Streptomyces sp. NPDC052042]|uniref:hypothetical protein n=1 Tax=Streptomyces sp. NPDC052042 TaxID=3365683 RepID=UPI0037D4D493
MSEVTGGRGRAEGELWVEELWKVYRRHDRLVQVQIKPPDRAQPTRLVRDPVAEPLGHRAGPRGHGRARQVHLLGRPRLARFSLDLALMGLGYAQVLENILETVRFPTVAALGVRPR